MATENAVRHPHAHHLIPRVLFYAHVVYYAATAVGFHTAHSVAAGSVLVLLILGAALGVASE